LTDNNDEGNSDPDEPKPCLKIQATGELFNRSLINYQSAEHEYKQTNADTQETGRCVGGAGS
jgi:hypothetical protein